MKSVGKKNIFLGLPVVLVATYDEDKKPNLMTAAWSTVIDYDKIMLIIDKSHKTYQNILKNKTAAISFANYDNIKLADYVGMISQNDNINKLDCLSLTDINIKYKTPIFLEFNQVMVLELIEFIEQYDMFIFNIKESFDNENYSYALYNQVTKEYNFIDSNNFIKAFKIAKYD